MNFGGADALGKLSIEDVGFRDTRLASIGEGTTELNRLVVKIEAGLLREFPEKLSVYLKANPLPETEIYLGQLLGLFKENVAGPGSNEYFQGRIERRIVDLMVDGTVLEMMKAEAGAGPLAGVLFNYTRRKVREKALRFIEEMRLAGADLPAGDPLPWEKIQDVESSVSIRETLPQI